VQASRDPSSRCPTVFIQQSEKLKNHPAQTKPPHGADPKDRAARRRLLTRFRAIMSPLDLQNEMQEACQFAAAHKYS
jgi:hypothetical protein